MVLAAAGHLWSNRIGNRRMVLRNSRLLALNKANQAANRNTTTEKVTNTHRHTERKEGVPGLFLVG